MNVEAWLEEFAVAYAEAGIPLSAAARRMLLSPLPETRTQEELEFSLEAKEKITALLFRKAARGRAFGDTARVKAKFGSTLEENYGLSTGPFLSLARAYWTLKIEAGDLLPQDSRLFLAQILLLVEREVASVFFPTPGPMMVPVAKRKEMQELLLRRYAPELDTQEFFAENPILRSEVTRQQRGCLGLFLLAFLLTAATLYLL